MAYLVLAESSLELVPPGLQSHPSVVSFAARVQKSPKDILLDNSWHYSAMKGIRDELKRGRPDLVHASILAASSTPLYKRNRLRIFVHTVSDNVIEVGQDVKFPRSYHRFAGLAEKLFRDKIIWAGSRTLLKLESKSFPQLIDELGPSRVVGLSSLGKRASFEQVGSKLDEQACIVVGGFQRGHFSELVQDRLDETYSVGDYRYDASVVVARLLYEYEKTIFM